MFLFLGMEKKKHQFQKERKKEKKKQQATVSIVSTVVCMWRGHTSNQRQWSG